MKYFKEKQYDRRIKITNEEYHHMIDAAGQLEEKFGCDDPLFHSEKPYILYRKTSSGCIPFHLYEPESNECSKIGNLYDTGNFLQECMNGGINDDVSPIRPMLTGNVYCDYESLLKTVIPQLENDKELNDFFRTNFTSLVANIQRMTIVNARKKGEVEDENSEFVSPFTSVDRSSKCVQKRNSNEAKKGTLCDKSGGQQIARWKVVDNEIELL